MSKMFYVILDTSVVELRPVEIFDEEALYGRRIFPVADEIFYDEEADAPWVKKIAENADEAKEAARKDFIALYQRRKKEEEKEIKFTKEVVKYCNRILKGLEV